MCFPSIPSHDFNPNTLPKQQLPSADPVLMLNKKALGYDQILLKFDKRHSLPPTNTSKNNTITGTGLKLL